jgi:hypothetical protein
LNLSTLQKGRQRDMSDEIMANDQVTDTQESSQAGTKTYTQEEFDRHMAGLKNSLTKKYEKVYADLGDPEELRRIKADAEKRKTEEQLKRGEFEKTLQEIVSKKDAQINQLSQTIKEYRVNTPIVDAAARYKSVNPDQVKALLANQVQLSEEGDVVVVDNQGSVRYTDAGTPLTVDDLVRDFLTTNPHFVSPGATTANTKTNTGVNSAVAFDLSKLDMSRPADRERYREAKSKGLI